MKEVKVIIDNSGPMLSVRVEGGEGLSRAEATVAAARLMEYVRRRYKIPVAAIIEVAETIATPGGNKEEG